MKSLPGFAPFLGLLVVLKGAGNKRVTFRQIPDRTHGSIANNIPKADDPVRKAILDFIAATPAATQH